MRSSPVLAALGRPLPPGISTSSPDMMTTGKGLTTGVIPMGAGLNTAEIHDAFMTGPENLI